MSTRSMIGIQTEKGTIKAIYCHWDGYPENNGAILLEHYNTPERIEALIALGDISSLAPDIEPPKEVSHSFDAPHAGVVVAYHRDRGEYLRTNEFRTERQFEKVAKNCWAEYNYLYKEGQWYVNHQILTREMCGLEELPEILDSIGNVA